MFKSGEYIFNSILNIFNSHGTGHKNNDIPVDADASRDKILLMSVKTKAHTIADNVRKKGTQKFGPAWAEGYGKLQDGRLVWLQQEQDEKETGKTLEINIYDTENIPYTIHIRYELKPDDINLYEVRQIDSTPITSYSKFDLPDLDARVPAALTIHEIIAPVDEILGMIVPISDNIMWKKPEAAQ